ncbi:hypothetical protein [Mycolicibacterium sphagni]|uniref:hypothetical protein n=1 Tax=Mycolicibacterium sphagni TaxID=1786 RepID=UPI0021F35A40|nr:hypothetical protein [Mycolicibacterium sphagni]MCV7177610.1 hypothetical protein [Mycolicibacterium sphagni]
MSQFLSAAPPWRMRRMSRACSALALLIGATVLPGCGGPANLTEVADDLQTALMAMPGVTDAWVYHDENYAEGVTFTIAVDVPTATREQITAVADRIAATHTALVSNYTQNVEFWVTSDKPVTITRQSRVDAGQIADDAERLRAIAANADGRIDWFRDDDGDVNQLSFTDSRTPDADLVDVVRQTAGDTAVTMSVSPSTPSRQTPRTVVSFPLSANDQTAVQQFLDTVGVDVFGVRIDGGRVQALEATVPADAAVAEQKLSSVIDASRGVAARPMWLAWYVPSALGGVPVFDGVVEVGDCSAPAAQIRRASTRTTPDAGSTLQARLQSKADTCTTADPVRTGRTQPTQAAPSPVPTTPLGQRNAPDATRVPEVASTVQRSTTAISPCGTAQFAPACVAASSGSNGATTTNTGPVRLPWPDGAPHDFTPRPAAGIDPTNPPSGGPPRSPTTARPPRTEAAHSAR